MMFDDEQQGFHKNYFARSMIRSIGTKCLIGLGLKATWKKHLTPNLIKKSLYSVFKAPDLKFYGDHTSAKSVFATWKNE